jgi:hypothetical protein
MWFSTPTSRAKEFFAACYAGNYQTVRKLVLGDRSLLNTKVMSTDATGLACAAERGHRYVVEFLLEQGASPNYAEKGDPTKSVNHPLIHACFNSHLTTIRALLVGGADVNAVSEFGTPLELMALRYKLEPQGAWLLFEHARRNNIVLKLRSVAEMRHQHDAKDIEKILAGLKLIQKRTSDTATHAAKTFRGIDSLGAGHAPSTTVGRSSSPSSSRSRKTRSTRTRSRGSLQTGQPKSKRSGRKSDKRHAM